MKTIEREEWRVVNGFSNYEVSNLGRVRSNTTGKILSQKIDRGYNRVRLYDEGRSQTKTVHRLVGTAFLDPEPNKCEINHIDGDKQNNSARNLEWCTRSENMKHAFDTGLKQPSGGLPNRKILVTETNTVYDSAYDCARAMNLDHGHIAHCLSGKRKTHNGYHFEYV